MLEVMSDATDLATAARDLNTLAYGYVSSWALLTACRRRLFDRLPARTEDLGDEYPDADLVTTWLSVLEAEGLVHAVDGADGVVWQMTETMTKLLVGDNSYADYLGGQVLEQLTPQLTLGRGDNQLEQALLAPEDRQGYSGWFEDDEEARRYQESQYAGSLGPARGLARQLDPSGRVLDLGGGWGAIARAVAQAHDVPVDVVDLEPVVASAPPADGVVFETGNALDPDTWPARSYDGAILSYLFSSVPGDSHEEVLGALAERDLNWIAVHDFMLGGGSLAPAWSLQHAVFVPGHRSRSVDEITEMLADHGWSDATAAPLVDEMTTLVVAAG